MIDLPFAKNKTYYVVGLGKSNQAVIKALSKAGADVRVWDDNADHLDGFDGKAVRSPDDAPWSMIKAVIMSPGIPQTHPAVVAARDKDIPVMCDIDLFAQSEPQTRIIGVTGTNGKSTVTALIHHILNHEGKAQIGGNIGTPVMDLKGKAAFTVLELSSYQLDYSPNLRCDVAVLLNITPDHLEWHGTMQDYIAAKDKIFTHATTKIISVDDEYSRDLCKAHEDAIPLTIHAEDLPFNPADFPRLRGKHNLQNMLAAYIACRSLDIAHETITERMKSFEGLAHRQYLVRVINGIPYINDSKATNAAAAKMALHAFRNIIWIAGGRAKEGGLEHLASSLKSVKEAVLFGEAKAEFYEFLKARNIPCHICETLGEAVTQAHRIAQDARGEPGGTPTVLLSPACASFDQYNNFEERGDDFTECVNALPDGD